MEVTACSDSPDAGFSQPGGQSAVSAGALNRVSSASGRTPLRTYAGAARYARQDLRPHGYCRSGLKRACPCNLGNPGRYTQSNARAAYQLADLLEMSEQDVQRRLVDVEKTFV